MTVFYLPYTTVIDTWKMSASPVALQMGELISTLREPFVVRDPEYNSIVTRIVGAFASLKVLCEQLLLEECPKKRRDYSAEVRPVAHLYITEIMTCVTGLCVWYEEVLDCEEWKKMSRTMCELVYLFNRFFCSPDTDVITIPTDDKFYGIYIGDKDAEELEVQHAEYLDRMKENVCVTYVGGNNVCAIKQSLLHWSGNSS